MRKELRDELVEARKEVKALKEEVAELNQQINLLKIEISRLLAMTQGKSVDRLG
jgi:uncharacterized small protein (DUF1192 family)